MNTKLLIFDLDGTLADTLHTIRDAVNMCMEHFDLPTQSYEQIKRNVGNGIRELIKRSLPESFEGENARFEEILSYFNNCYCITHDKVDGCYEGLYEVIMSLHVNGYKLAVLSNKPDAYVKRIIKNLFPDGVIEIAMGQTELPRKPDPSVALMIANQLGFDAKNTYFIGDSEVDVLTAKNAGMKSIAVSWGFRDRNLLELNMPDIILDTPNELFKYLET